MTNTVPTDAYRGAGRPEAAYLLERFVDHIARETGLTPDELRKRNLVKPNRDSVGHGAGRHLRLRRFRQCHAEGHGEGRLEGLPGSSRSPRSPRASGVASAWRPMSRNAPAAPLRSAIAKFNEDDTITVFVGVQTNGQGHETAFTQIMSARLGVDADRIRIVQGDSDFTPEGMTGGSRSIPVAGAAVLGVSDKIIEKGKLVAASAMEAAAGDIEYKDATFRIVGTDRTMSLFDVARAAKDSSTSRQVKSPVSMATSRVRRRPRPSPTAAMSASSRSIPTPARCRS